MQIHSPHLPSKPPFPFAIKIIGTLFTSSLQKSELEMLDNPASYLPLHLSMHTNMYVYVYVYAHVIGWIDG